MNMTQEEKAKAYDEVLEKSKEFYILCKKCGAKDTVDFLEDNFPELRESEDEKVKRILRAIWDKMSFYLDDIFTEEEFQCFDAWSNAWPQEQKKFDWSPEDEHKIKDIVYFLDTAKKHYASTIEIDACIDWLEKLKLKMKGGLYDARTKS